MTGQAGQLQPDGQARSLRRQVMRALARIPSAAWLLLALTTLASGFNRGGIWDPFELRMAELARRLAPQLFRERVAEWAESATRIVTATEIGQGELTATSTALGFALFGVSDWAGRIASLFWGATALLALWLLLGRLSGRIAQVTSVLILASTPLFAWQSRTMLGDAATIATQTLATVGLLFLCRTGQEIAWSSRAWAAVLALSAAGLGCLCRGVLTGVSIPTLAVGFASLASNSDQKGRRFQLRAGYGLLAVGFASAVLGVKEALWAKNGFSSLLGSTLRTSIDTIPFDSSVGTLLHQAFPLSAFLPWTIAGLVLPRRGNRTDGDEHWVALVFAWVSVLAFVNGIIMARRGVSFAFPSVPALAALTGISVQNLFRRPSAASVASISVLTLSVLLFADFTNTPETQLLLTGVQGGQLPESFVPQGRPWLRASLAALLVGGTATILFNTALKPRAASWRTRLMEPIERVRTAFGGQLLSGLILAETTLGTLALLQRAHDEGWITVPWFDTTRALFGSFLSWAWALPPLLLFVAPTAFVLVRLIFERLGPRYPFS
ncbi:MAG TPA: glycosyltransferase family 39 protein, partial [Polyangiaceae bacterium]|nr:glycosyltransferase family 39 protein [Polyangiaceae bacterium]